MDLTRTGIETDTIFVENFSAKRMQQKTIVSGSLPPMKPLLWPL